MMWFQLRPQQVRRSDEEENRVTIYKYNLDENYTIIKGKIRRFLKVQRQGNHIVCWAEIDESLEEIEVRIVAIGTGWPMKDFLGNWEYIGTEIDVEGYVWHYYSDMVPNLRISQKIIRQNP